MKNLFLTLAFVFGTASTFAGDSNIVEEVDDCINVTLSCGVSGCVYVTSTQMLIDHIEFAEAYWCED
ncbi:MAG: hypothetical protein CL526_01935 [Aequorivita sp.]|nr:hypothetical protein [Aequorivita sp.]|tara:strand:+ start:2402 stop:2602 length:201 start_codon:yes stop_codon:yes gene_type:complete